MKKIQDIEVIYAGAFPNLNLCSGSLRIRMGNFDWEFPDHCLSSGGSVTFDENWSEDVTTGPWEIRKWPENFPEQFKKAVLDAVNAEIPWGCCGGCV